MLRMSLCGMTAWELASHGGGPRHGVLGLDTTRGDRLFISLLGSAFFGAFAAKVTVVELRRFPTAVLPIAGGFLFALLIAVWYTSALWFFRQFGVDL